MTQRSILASETRSVIIHAGKDVTVKGWESNRVEASSSDRWGLQVTQREDETMVEITGSGEVHVPMYCAVKVYAGKNADVGDVLGEVTAYAGRNLHLQTVQTLVHASSGGAMEVDCETLGAELVKLTSGRDMRLRIRQLTGATLKIKDMSGSWEAVIGDGAKQIVLTAGGEVTLVTGQEALSQPPQYTSGETEWPAAQAPDRG